MGKEFKIYNAPLDLESVIEVKENDNRYGIVKGVAAAFGNKDLGNDIIEYGAFAKFLKESGPIVPILNNHSSYDPIGYNVEAEEIQRGLKIKGQINLLVKSGFERYALAKQALEVGTKAGLSIGYQTVKEEYNNQTGVRTLKEVKLYEYSFVTFPMNPKAVIDSAKYLEFLKDKNFIEAFIKELRIAGYTLETAKEALKSCMDDQKELDEIRADLKETSKLFRSFKI